jgi:hypothetical protein
LLCPFQALAKTTCYDKPKVREESVFIFSGSL